MTIKAPPQLLALAGIVALLIAVVVARRGDTPAAQTPAPSNPARETPAATTKAAPAVVVDVRLELLKSDRAKLEPSARNPFQFRPKAPPPAPPRPAAGRGGATAPVIVGPPPPPPGPPPIALKYIGVLDSAQGKLAIFKDAGDNVLNGREGDIIDGRYKLLKIGVESADLSYVDGRGRQTIRLSGQ